MDEDLKTRVSLVEDRVERHRKELDEMKAAIRGVSGDLGKLTSLIHRGVWMFYGAAALFLLNELGLLALLKSLLL